MEDTVQIIQQCNESFVEADYSACLESLEKLRNKSTVKNCFVEFNKFVANFFQSELCTVDEFAQNLSSLSSISEARSTLNEYLLFNQAVLEYHAGRYSRAVELLTQNLIQSNLSENVLIHSVLLLAEVYLILRQPEQVLKVLTKCENYPNDRSNFDLETSNDLKCRLCLAKVRACLLLRNYKMCQKEAKKLTNFSSCSLWASTLLRAQHEYQRSASDKSVKYILNAKDQPVGRLEFSSSGIFSSSVEYNSLGCLYYQMNKPNLSLVYFRKSLNEYSAAFNSFPRNSDGQLKVPLYCRSSVFRLYLLQNYGLALLHCQQPAAAFDCLIEIVKLVNSNARLWLRLAECCILAHKPNNEVDFEMQRRKRLMVKEVVGVGPHRKIILNTNLSGRKSNLPNEQGAMPTLSLEFAHFCLKNALATLPVMENDVVNSLSETNGDSAAAATEVGGQTYPAPFSNPMTVKEVYRLKCSILCATSYVCLCLGEIQLAFESAKTLLNQKFVSSTHKLLGQLYAAEASIMSERINEALNYLKPQLTPDRELTFAELWHGAVGKESPAISNWFPKTAASFKIIFHYNIALAYTLQEDYEKAIQAITSIGDNVELPIQVTMLGLYIQIQLGQIESARYTIMKTFPQLQTPLSFS